MITSDPKFRAERQAQILAILSETTAAEDRGPLLSFAPLVIADMPDSLAHILTPEILAERMRRHFNFVAREIPPAIQLYRGVPGIHVSVTNPTDVESEAMGGGAGLPLETTIVRTHTVDAPFIFDSLKNYFSKAGLRVFNAIHPIFTARRQWERVVWIGGPHDEGNKEVYCHFQIEPVDSKERRRRMEHEIFSVLKSVFLAVEDFQKMQAFVRGMDQYLRSRRDDISEVSSALAFLEWLLDENYVFMGTARYRPAADGKVDRLHESVLGVFADEALLPVVFPGLIEELEARIIPAPGDDRIVGIDYCRNAAAIHHLQPIDYIVLREWGPGGNLAGATLLLGRFARGTFVQRADRIPLLHDKVEKIFTACAALPNSHLQRSIRATFDRLPMRELFYAPPESLKSIIEPIVYRMSDDEINIHVREGAGYQALAICFSRLSYSHNVGQALANALAQEFGPVSFHTYADCGSASLLLFYFDTEQLDRAIDVEEVRKITAPLVTTWEARVAAALESSFGEREGRRLYRLYVREESRSGLYREVAKPSDVPEDIRKLEVIEGRLELRLEPLSAQSMRAHIYSMHSLGLTATLRTLQNLGLSVTEEMRIPLQLPEDRKCFLYRLDLEAPVERMAALREGSERFLEALRAVEEERTTDDPLNGLILAAGLSWREVELLRTLRNHLLQIRSHYNVETVNGVLLRHPKATFSLFSSFAARFEPCDAGGREGRIEDADRAVQAALQAVTNLAEDEVLRALHNLVTSALRTNFFQKPERPVFSIKVEGRKVEGMPSPRPMVEIYVHSRLIEGIHLRGGRVARGGIRWSDRHDDFRTEVLGLMKTQMVKNAIIVPVGSKGGFVLKGDVPPRPALDAYLVDRYREFVSGLLDVTDNIVDGRILHPPDVVRFDTDDPYLVVAADKGTAHLSDTANSVSNQYGFWLGDAFASGGSHGYDHKQVGITARGTWECVKHHFRNLGVDIQQEPFTVVGIGDMGGDVFGNGMLQSRMTRLLAAFDHRHIFIDPDPDMERSYLERNRLFHLPRSSWRDYDPGLISPGGGIFDRSAKAIPVTPQMRELFGLEAESVSGEEMIRRILVAPVDLLYSGGIGTYVKGSTEDNADVGDRSNDRVRVNANELRVRVVGEGGNLGLTQKARLEYWMRGGSLNTDALDNSGGVDMSDHEVNIKILLDMLVKRGVISGKDERNRILAEMTEEVAALVLADNENQSRALTLDGQRSASDYDAFVALVEEMVVGGIVNRQDEDIPVREDLMAGDQRGRGLPRPLLAKLLGYSKMWAFEQVMNTGLPDSATARIFLDEYFPGRLRAQYAAYFTDHRLRREIIATGVVNYIINCGGFALLPRLISASGKGIAEVVGAWIDADRRSGAPGARRAVLRAGFDAAKEHRFLLEIEKAVEDGALANLRGKEEADASEIIDKMLAQLR